MEVGRLQNLIPFSPLSNTNHSNPPQLVCLSYREREFGQTWGMDAVGWREEEGGLRDLGHHCSPTSVPIPTPSCVSYFNSFSFLCSILYLLYLFYRVLLSSCWGHGRRSACLQKPTYSDAFYHAFDLCRINLETIFSCKTCRFVHRICTEGTLCPELMEHSNVIILWETATFLNLSHPVSERLRFGSQAPFLGNHDTSGL